GHRAAMSPPASERADPITPHVHVTHTLRPSNGARTAQRTVPTTALNTYAASGASQHPRHVRRYSGPFGALRSLSGKILVVQRNENQRQRPMASTRNRKRRRKYRLVSTMISCV